MWNPVVKIRSKVKIHLNWYNIQITFKEHHGSAANIGCKLLLENYRDKVIQTLEERKARTGKVVRAPAKSIAVTADLWASQLVQW